MSFDAESKNILNITLILSWIFATRSVAMKNTRGTKSSHAPEGCGRSRFWNMLTDHRYSWVNTSPSPASAGDKSEEHALFLKPGRGRPQGKSLKAQHLSPEVWDTDTSASLHKSKMDSLGAGTSEGSGNETMRGWHCHWLEGKHSVLGLVCGLGSAGGHGPGGARC